MANSAETAAVGLTRSFGAASLTLFGVGAVVGAGIFVLTGRAAALYAGPAVTLSFLLAALVCGLSALCYAELAAMSPVAGAAYSFTRYSFGTAVGWVVGWALVAELLFAAGAISIGWSAYVQDFFGGMGLHLPTALASSPFSFTDRGLEPTGSLVNLPAVALVLVLSGLLYAGTRESARFNSIIVLIKLSAVVLFIGFGLAFSHAHNWIPFLPDRVVRPDGSSAYGWGGVLKAAGIVLFAFIGFDTVATAAQETRRPERNVPIGLLASLAISTALYIGVTLAMTGLVDFHRLDTAAPLTVALGAAGAPLAWLKTYVGVAASIGLGSAVLVALFALSRLYFSMARDGLLPAGLAGVHAPSGAPRPAVLSAAVGSVIVAGCLPIGLLGELVSTGTLLAFAMVCASVFRLRLREPDRARPFRVPFWPLTTVLGIVSCLFLLIGLGLPAIGRMVAWQGVGLVILAISALARWRR